jgi:hypothetical protein
MPEPQPDNILLSEYVKSLLGVDDLERHNIGIRPDQTNVGRTTSLSEHDVSTRPETSDVPSGLSTPSCGLRSSHDDAAAIVRTVDVWFR